jgi:hypothetical protein
MNEMLTAVRKTVTKKAPTWARTVDGIVRRWEEQHNNHHALSGMCLDDRLQRLFVAACCRSALPDEGFDAGSSEWKLIEDALEAVEQLAEGSSLTDTQSTTIRRLRWCAVEDAFSRRFGTAFSDASRHVNLVVGLNRLPSGLRLRDICYAASDAVKLVIHRVKRPRALRRRQSEVHHWGIVSDAGGAANAHGRAVAIAEADERTRQGQLLAGIIGPDWQLAPEWCTGTAVQLARGIYDRREFNAMPILADALQDAGCDTAEWLARMRDPNWPWCRGCHVLDSLLPELVHTGG